MAFDSARAFCRNYSGDRSGKLFYGAYETPSDAPSGLPESEPDAVQPDGIGLSDETRMAVALV